MAKTKSFAERRFAEIVKTTSSRWGGGWDQLGAALQAKQIHSAVFAELVGVARLPSTDPAVFLEHVRELGQLAMQWEGEQS